MTTAEFMAGLLDHYGKPPNQSVLDSVTGYADTKTPAFRIEMLDALKESHPTRFGYPEVPDMMKLANLAGTRAIKYAPELIDSEARATPEEVAQAMAPVVKKIEEQAKESGYYRLNRPKPFGHLDGIRTEIEKEKS